MNVKPQKNQNPYDALRRMNVGFQAGSAVFHLHRPTLIMVHGAGGCAELWLNQVGPLSRLMNTVALDLPGHGGTPGPPRPSIAGYARWLEEVIDATFRKDVILMGHSMGGAVVLQTALQGRAAVQGLVLAATGARLRVAPAFLEGLSRDFERAVEDILSCAYAPGVSLDVLREGAHYFQASGEPLVSSDFEACNAFDARREAARLECRCLVLCGEQDRLTPPKWSRELERLVSNSTLHFIPEAGHMLMIERPREVNRAVADFVESLQREDPPPI